MKPRYIIVEDEHWELRGLEARVGRLLPQFLLAGTATNGREGLELARAARPDIALTDIRMPEMDGLALAEALHHEQPDCAVVMISGFSEFEYARQAIRFGVRGYLLKPVQDQELEQALLASAHEHSLRTAARLALPEGADEPGYAQRLMLEVREYVGGHYQELITVKSIAKRYALDVSSLSRQFKRVCGINLSDYIAGVRLEAARKLLLTTNLSSAEVGARTGFSDASYFYRAFRRAYGKPPGEYRDTQSI